MNRLKLEPYQVKIAYTLQNQKLKLFKTNLNIKFNKICLYKNVIPNYAKIKINETSRMARKTEQFASKYRIKEEIKFLYGKKISLNLAVYKAHLELYNNVHPALCDTIIQHINQYVKNKIRFQKNKQTNKIGRLISNQNNDKFNSEKHAFYPRLINMTNVVPVSYTHLDVYKRQV